MLRKLERLRSSMQQMAEQYGINDLRVIRQSQMLDKLIVKYMRSLPNNKSKLQADTSLGETLRLCESILRLYEEIEGSERAFDENDPLILEKSRELDRMIVEFIRK
ncbi:aspartyl-phosphate phosphatase Spo0E family protein [Cohnella yongneupensis]|uniref:Aspartyl-phosphate phosphatase Spo0E family protein n=1 Tax=Cohnella yongneupensis TaxID=425006 RepID=A0ABW0R5I8_9BACL